ncbi:hypothetical protein D5018_09465 [Parashewanella curva]|uniref:Uncharacterized protein n=1 Tax=Parashewanella curva TaxID=2338552 RepID=A0A3L8PX64_9GAMM|nr:hypothetical protein [Parashewanella curva]RLV59901.1 hypothetical protein D5018_09465 [Parashewanella curva]
MASTGATTQHSSSPIFHHIDTVALVNELSDVYYQWSLIQTSLGCDGYIPGLESQSSYPGKLTVILNYFFNNSTGSDRDKLQKIIEVMESPIIGNRALKKRLETKLNDPDYFSIYRQKPQAAASSARNFHQAAKGGTSAQLTDEIEQLRTSLSNHEYTLAQRDRKIEQLELTTKEKVDSLQQRLDRALTMNAELRTMLESKENSLVSANRQAELFRRQVKELQQKVESIKQVNEDLVAQHVQGLRPHTAQAVSTRYTPQPTPTQDDGTRAINRQPVVTNRVNESTEAKLERFVAPIQPCSASMVQLSTLLNKTVSIADIWEQIGINLFLSQSALNALKQKPGADAIDHLTDVYSNASRSLSWEKHAPYIGLKGFAYCVFYAMISNNREEGIPDLVTFFSKYS